MTKTTRKPGRKARPKRICPCDRCNGGRTYPSPFFSDAIIRRIEREAKLEGGGSNNADTQP